jgi:hypothetical protein
VIFSAVLANFLLEGQDRMTGHVPLSVSTIVTWHVVPITPPRPHRHCPGCNLTRPFSCSGKVRLNANGRRLDAWLIYKCTTCDRTWNLPMIDRVAVSAIDPQDLWAMQVSDPAWVEARAFDLALLRPHADLIDLPTDLRVIKAGPGVTDWCEIRLDLCAPRPTGHRLDRLLATELGLSRSRLHRMLISGGLSFGQGPRRALKTRVAGTLCLHFVAKRLDPAEKAGLTRALLDPAPKP